MRGREPRSDPRFEGLPMRLIRFRPGDWPDYEVDSTAAPG